jgi:bacillithiol biosynthesis cysteine-adding enzyme BshC
MRTETIPHDPRRAPKLFLDLVQGAPPALAFYPGAPRDPAALESVAARAGRAGRDRAALADALAAYNASLDAGPAALDAVQALQGGALVVCGGQQPGAFTGPLFTIWKAAGCVRLARLWTERTGRRHVPVFWNHSQDHDLAEVDHVHVLNRGHEPQRFRVAVEGPAGRPLSEVSAEPARRTLQDILRALPETEFTAQVGEVFAPSPGDTLGTWFSRILLRLFRDTDLVLMEPRLLQDAFRPVLEREIAEPLTTSRRLAEEAARLREAGYAPSFPGQPQPEFLVTVDGRRMRPRFEGGAYVAGNEHWSPADAAAALREQPGRFSPSVALRPIAQAAALPVVAYVGGPAEVSYYGQLLRLHDDFGVVAPLVAPRPFATVVEGPLEKIMQRYGVQPPELFSTPAENEKRLPATELPPETAAALQRLEETVRKEGEAVVGAVVAADAGFAPVGKKALEQLQRSAAFLRDRALEAVRNREGAGRRQLRRLFNTTCPRGEPQERVLTVLPFALRHGPGFVRELTAALDPESDGHQVVFTGGAEEAEGGA